MLFVVVNCWSYGIVYVVQLNIYKKKKRGWFILLDIMKCLYEPVNTEDLFLFCSFRSFRSRKK